MATSTPTSTSQQWQECASRVLKTCGAEGLQEFILNTASNSRQMIADRISFRQKLINTVKQNPNWSLCDYLVKEDERIINQAQREDRFFRFYDC